jgi:hypothetical protein
MGSITWKESQEKEKSLQKKHEGLEGFQVLSSVIGHRSEEFARSVRAEFEKRCACDGR